jgi:hypothetical protein
LGTLTQSLLVTDRTVELLAEDVVMAVVGAGVLDHVDEDSAKG